MATSDEIPELVATTEPALASMWCELLGVAAVKPTDQILCLGGNSLVATMLANRIEMEWGFRPTVEQLFSSTLRELACACDKARTTVGQ